MKRLFGLGPVLLLSLAVVASTVVGLNLSHDSNDDLAFYGPYTLGAIEGVHPGETIGFALPVMRNTSAWPLRIDGFRLDHLPSGTQLVGFRLLDVHETEGVRLGSFPANHGCRNPVVAGYDCFRDYLPSHPVIQPGRLSDYYPVIYLKLLHRPTPDTASGCEYLYTVEGVQHEQRAWCLLHMQHSLG